ncbi:efflux RND transporter periplasmic adaptor subunit [Candidatus Palauibacter sp.]|uniref:efflux RND transporter periplasmic adaptor subunit n=1 Tax=Candidatus Palauibacter sp. TaxID=3101350 RepID=UPI003AF2B472
MTRRRTYLTAGGILLGSVLVAAVMVALRPDPPLRPPDSGIPYAATAPAVAGEGAIPVYGAGTVRPSAEINVAAEINGKVSWVAPTFQSGGRVREGQVLFRIDDADYQNRVRQARANVAAQQVALLQAEEEARIARSEYAQYRNREASSTTASPLTLREPQLEAARAALARDSAGLADAELALSRTAVRAPFDGVVRDEAVDIGQFVSAGVGVGRLYAADAVEVVVPLSDADVALIPGLWELESGGSRVAARVIAEYGDERYAWQGQVDRVEASLDAQTRTIDVIVRVPEPFAAGAREGADEGASWTRSPPLLVGKFVEVRIDGAEPSRYFVLRRPALRTGDEVWAVRDDTLVTIVPVRVLQRSDDDVFVIGALEGGQPVVVGGLRIATEGMRVRTAASEENPDGETTETAAQVHDPNYLGTFSIIGRDPDTGQLGMGVQSKAFGAGNRAMHAKGGLVIIAHQAAANPMYGAIGIELLQAGYSPEEALAMMVASDEGRDRRQTAILDQQGRTAAWTGTGASDWKGHKCGVDYCAQGNILTGPEVVDAMAASFESSTGPLAERLMDALDAAQAAGGDARGMQSGAILVVAPRVNGGYSDRVVDIRVDDHDEPLVELRRVLHMYRSGQMLREAGRMRRDGDLRGAVALVREATRKSPENDNVWVSMAAMLFESGREDAAFEALERAVELNPGRRRTLPRDDDFASVRDDPRFLRIIGN